MMFFFLIFIQSYSELVLNLLPEEYLSRKLNVIRKCLPFQVYKNYDFFFISGISSL